MAAESNRLPVAARDLGVTLGRALQSRKVWIWIGVWLLTRALIVSHVGYWQHGSDVQFEDVHTYEVWSDEIAANHALPHEEAWQYPPGAAFLMLLPRLGWSSFGTSFVAIMLAFDLLGLALLAVLGRREGSYTGVWVWLLGMPLLRSLPVLRFDLVPAVIGIASLVAIHRRPNWFGALAGLGASVKVWPIVVLFGEWDRRRLLRAVLAAIATVAAVFAISALAFGDQSGFLSEQNGRGLQVESVASVPWHLRQIVTGEAPQGVLRFGAWEIDSGPADLVASLLKWVSLAALAASGAWWLARSRAIRRGRRDLTEAAVSRDFVFTVVLLLVVTSRVLSPQYMIWLLGLAAVVLAAKRTRLARPAWIVIGATILTTSAYGSADNTVIRNLALLAATVDASITMIGQVRFAPGEGPRPRRSASGLFATLLSR
jgi:Glycosyltransferase family 87